MQAHGTRYQLKHEPFVAFDLMFDIERARYDDLISRVKHGDFVTPTVIHRGRPLSIEAAMKMLKTDGFHGASDQVEGAYGELNETSWPIPARMASAFGGLVVSYFAGFFAALRLCVRCPARKRLVHAKTPRRKDSQRQTKTLPTALECHACGVR